MSTQMQPDGYSGSNDDLAWRRLVYPNDYKNPEPAGRYHLAVIGAGPAGLVTAIAAAGLGARVVLIEKTAMGGDCLNVGCVPSKALLEITANSGNDGDFDAAFAWLRKVRARIAEHDSVERYVDAGVDVYLGKAKFINDTTLSVMGTELSMRRTVIATGARASIPPIPGLVDSRPLTNETVFDLQTRPKRLAIIGGGPIGCELALAFSRLNIEVHLLEVADQILGNATREAAEIVAATLRSSGVQLHLAVKISAAARRGPVTVIDIGDGEIVADEVLVAAGRRANIDELNLAAVGVETDAGGKVSVDDYLRTTNPKIFAAGDVCSRYQFTHNADAQARIVVQNALFFPSVTTRKLIVPNCTYTDPEVAQVGETKTTLESNHIEYDEYRVAFNELDRGQAEGDDVGFVEVLTASGKSRILGATIVGHDAGEQIASLCVAMANGLGLDAFGKAVLPYPTRGEYLRRLADQFNRTKLTSLAKRLFEMWFKWSARG